MCETCIHESVCMFRGDFIELHTKASNDVYGSIFNVTCNEYREKEDFKLYHTFDLDDEKLELLRNQIIHEKFMSIR